MRDRIPYERVRELPMFNGVDDSVLSSLLKTTAARLRRYGRQETVFETQSAVRHVFVVLSGELKINEYGANGVAHILRICRPGHIVGLAHILGVHRTALSRTLAQLVASGQLFYRKNVFRLLK